MYYTFVSPHSCYAGVKTFLMYALYYFSPVSCYRCEDLSDVGTILLSALSHVMQVWRSFWCMYHTFVSPVSCYVGVKIFLMYALYFCQPCICYVGVKTFLMYTFVSPVSCYVGVKIFLMYALYFCQPCLMLCRCEDLSDVCTILLSALSHVM